MKLSKVQSHIQDNISMLRGHRKNWVDINDFVDFPSSGCIKILDELEVLVGEIQGSNAEVKVQFCKEIYWLRATLEKFEFGKNISSKYILNDISNFIEGAEWLLEQLNDW